MQIKAYRLAAELRVSEGTLLKWLHERGYPEARSHDWLSGQLAQAARRALGAQVRTPALSSALVSAQGNAPSTSSTRRVSAELLSGLQALSTQPASAASLHPASSVSPPEHPLSRPYDAASAHAHSPSQAHSVSQESLKGEGSERSESLNRELVRLQQALTEQCASFELQLQSLRASHERASHERSLYRKQVLELEGQQATISQAYEELSLERDALREDQEALKEELTRTLEQSSLQKEAWQARAQELEEQVHSGKRLPHQLKELGLEGFEDQVKLFQTLLSTPESATRFFRVIKMVDREGVKRLVDERVVPTCAQPMCNQTNTLRHKLSLRVDRSKRCGVCAGELDRRWFQRMLATCERAHVKRLLMVGGEEVHPRVRALMEGEAVSCRFISSQEVSALPRVQSRLGSADLLITWPEASLNPEMVEVYRAEAHTLGTLTVELSSECAEVSRLARAVLNLVQRSAGGA